MSGLIDFPGIGVIPDPAADREVAHDRRAQAIEEASRALVNRHHAVLVLPLRLVDGRLQRIFQIAFDDGSSQLVTMDSARVLQREMAQLIALLDGQSPT